MKDYYRDKMHKAFNEKNRLLYGYYCGRLWNKPALESWTQTKKEIAEFPGNDELTMLLTNL